MKIETEVRGEISIKSVRYYESTTAKIATVRLSARMDRDTTKKCFGVDFARLVLPEMGKEARDEAGSYHHAYTTIKPVAVFESHKVAFPEPIAKEVSSIPEMAGVTAVDKEEAVDIELDVPFQLDAGAASLIGKIAEKVGDTIAVTFTPKQLALPLGEARVQAKGSNVIRVPGPHGGPVPKVVG